MDIKKGKINVSVSIVFKIVTMIMSILVKMTLVDICGNEVNGLNSLFLSIIGVLSVVELGVGSAITFCMYKPIVEGNNETVSALYHLFKKLYYLIGMIIFGGGLIITPFLKYLAKDYTELNVNMYITFLLVLVSVTLTYAFSAKTSLINAYKNNYITTAITQGGIVLQYVLQIVVLFITHSFIGYLICRIVAVLVQWITTEVVVKNKYDVIIGNEAPLDSLTKDNVKKNIKAMFMHKIGHVMVNTVDSVIISAFVGVVLLGKYSNYTMILSSMTGIITLVFTSLTSVIGHLCVEEKRETAQKYYESFHLMNFMIGGIFFFGYYAVIDNLISILFSEELIISKNMILVITINGFVQFMRRNTLTFRDATGTFYYDRWKPLFEGILNIILSIIFVKVVGTVGVIIATIITNLVICHLVEPYVLYKKAFLKSPNRFYLRNYSMILLFTVFLFVLNRCMVTINNNFIELFINGIISLALSGVLCGCIMLLYSKETKLLIDIVKRGK